MATDAVDIANMALGVLDEAPIDSLDDNSKAARLLNLHYDITRQAELSKHDWTFAIFSASVAGYDTESGSGTFNWEYELPSDCLRVLPLTYDGEPSGEPIGWRREGSLLYSDQSSPRIIRYIGNLTDPDDWDATFTEVLIGALAVKIAYPLSHKTGMIEVAQNAYGRALDAARRANAFQRSGALYQTSWATARGDTRLWRP